MGRAEVGDWFPPAGLRCLLVITCLLQEATRCMMAEFQGQGQTNESPLSTPLPTLGPVKRVTAAGIGRSHQPLGTTQLIDFSVEEG